MVAVATRVQKLPSIHLYTGRIEEERGRSVRSLADSLRLILIVRHTLQASSLVIVEILPQRALQRSF